MVKHSNLRFDWISFFGFIFVVVVVLPFLYLVLGPGAETAEQEWNRVHRRYTHLNRQRLAARRRRHLSERSRLQSSNKLDAARRSPIDFSMPVVPEELDVDAGRATITRIKANTDIDADDIV